MFRQIISDTPLTTDAANGFFSNISGDVYQGDRSFVCTLRALVAPRMKKDEYLHLSFTQSSYTAQRLSTVSARKAIKDLCDIEYYAVNCTETITVHSFCADSQEDNYAWLELMKSTFESVYPGWHRLEKVTDFFRKSFYVLCFINPETRNVLLFVDNMNIRKLHYLQCSVFAFLPWYFNPKDGVSDVEMALIQSLREKSPDKYTECVAAIAEQYDFRTANIRKLLAGFETRYEQIECDRVRNDIRRAIDNISALNEQIGAILRTKRDNEIRLLGLETKIAQSDDRDSEIMEYFLCNNKLVLERVTGTDMVFAVKGYLTYFDEDMARRIINNYTSYVYSYSNIPADDIHDLMEAIFVEQKLKIRFCAAYKFDLNGSVYALRDHHFGSECRTCMPNPHIDKYSCMGNYHTTINVLLRENNYIGAIEQCVASCQSLNFGDSTVMLEFMRTLYGNNQTNNRCIELPDGNVVNTKEAITWLRAQEGINEQDN